jgi:BirA family biotin operon repressor/biotin-[acetyl-CoA-carboxylase] ligase
VTPQKAWPDGYARLHFESIGSTNDEARALAASNQQGAVWIYADRQTAARGRRGRAWESPTGNLSATLLIDPDKPARECAQLSFVAALAAHETIAHYLPDGDVRVKWPNDILANGKKLVGILLESASTGNEPPSWLAIGIGINLAHFPPDTETPATSLAAEGVAAPTNHDAIARLASAFAKWYDIWQAQGFAPIRDAWLARAAGLGTRVRARLQNEETSGVFEGIDETGALLLREGVGRVRVIAAGDVFF